MSRASALLTQGVDLGVAYRLAAAAEALHAVREEEDDSAGEEDGEGQRTRP